MNAEIKKQGEIAKISGIVVVFCAIMAIVDGVLQADYFMKSAIKLVLFLGFRFVRRV